ncbi:Hyaluronoglucosaminidase precursor [Mycoplasmopsis californica]|uniref:Beta-N-acetylglucosaminidase domain-containing protein n=1 Tax=Mycoplasmopsis equigenitalium TaxID=114883 RepID=A0ABY5J2P2_9BACT|nr:beta-N-acetylglucosaminidase domain-containing protein [Mycoplasmopsis equigenitalium]UUD37038.1 beta-N-acetylglucosaminidase domain-containing protein [Mycoplasmopsis equigenitalium]VEU69662.1 Hyaluronoglucosaminidase precursor [Mycoplasmopsis californica]
MTKRKILLHSLMIPVVAVGAVAFSVSAGQTRGGTSSVLDDYLAKVATLEYKVDPAPQSITYENKAFIISQEINLRIDANNTDEFINPHIQNTLAIKQLQLTTKEDEGITKFLVGIKGGTDAISKEIETKYASEISQNDFTKHDAYTLIVRDNVVAILAKDKHALFPAFTTLKWVFEEANGLAIRNFVVNDYAHTQIRGFIEGYYGIPWSWEDRRSLMKFGGKYKTNSYIYAPKDDPYHSKKWYELYPNEQLEEIRKTVRTGHENGVYFTWTAHPWMSSQRIDLNNKYDAELVRLKAKFQQLYDAGVRQFGIQADDVGGVSPTIVAKMMTDLYDWGKSEGRQVVGWTFCPDKYEGTGSTWSGTVARLKEWQSKLPYEDFHIFYTGSSVLAPVAPYSTKWWYDQTPSGKKRGPLFWLNWPVNDPDYTALNLGPGTMLQNGVQPEHLSGVVTNPMQEAELSKISVAAISSYAWNITDFRAWESWEKSFEKIEPDAPEALRKIASHITSTNNPNNGIKNSGRWGVSINDESKHIRDDLNKIETDRSASTFVEETFNKVLNEAREIQAAVAEFNAKTKNEKLKREVKDFGISLDLLAKAMEHGLLAFKEVRLRELDTVNHKAGDVENAAVYHKTLAKKYFEQSQNIWRSDILQGWAKGKGYPTESVKVKPGRDYLFPFVQKLLNDWTTIVTPASSSMPGSGIYTGPSSTNKITLTPSTNLRHYESNTIDKAADNNTSTKFWSGSVATANTSYFLLTFSKAGNVKSTQIFGGESAISGGDWFTKTKLEYQTTDGNWHEWAQFTSHEFEKTETSPLKDVKALRMTPLEVNSNWIQLREWKVTFVDVTAPDPSNYPSQVNTKPYSNLADPNSYGAFNYLPLSATFVKPNTAKQIVLNQNEYYGIALSKISEITSVVNEIAGTGTQDLKLEGSENELVWEEFDAASVSASASKKYRYIRIINKTANPITFDLNNFKLVIKDNVISDFTGWNLIKNEWGTEADGMLLSHLLDGDISTPAKLNRNQTAGNEIIVDLINPVDVKNFKIWQHKNNIDYLRDAEIFLSADNNDYTKVITIGDGQPNAQGDGDLAEIYTKKRGEYNYLEAADLDLKGIRYVKIRFTASYSYRWAQLNELEFNDELQLPIVNHKYVSADWEAESKHYGKLFDVNGVFVSEKETGSLEVKADNLEETTYNTLWIQQEAGYISNANVTLKVFNKATQEIEEINAGTLADEINIFRVDDTTYNLLSYKLDYTSKLHIKRVVKTKDSTDPNYTNLDAELTKESTINKEKWTKNQKDVVKRVVDRAKEMKAKNLGTQATVDSITAQLKYLLTYPDLKVDVSALEALVLKDASLYTPKSYDVYLRAFNLVQDALKDKENLTAHEVEVLTTRITTAEAGLIYELKEYQLALEAYDTHLNNLNTILESDFISGYQEFKTALETLKTTLDIPNTGEVTSPLTFKKQREQLEAAFKNLVVDKNVDTSELKTIQEELALLKDTEVVECGLSSTLDAQIEKELADLETYIVNPIKSRLSSVKTHGENLLTSVKDQIKTKQIEALNSVLSDVSALETNNKVVNNQAKITELKNKVTDKIANWESIKNGRDSINEFTAECQKYYKQNEFWLEVEPIYKKLEAKISENKTYVDKLTDEKYKDIRKELELQIKDSEDVLKNFESEWEIQEALVNLSIKEQVAKTVAPILDKEQPSTPAPSVTKNTNAVNVLQILLYTVFTITIIGLVIVLISKVRKTK